MALIACYLLAIFVADKRDSLSCLFAMLLSIAAFISPASPSNTHLLICCSYAVFIPIVSIRLKIAMFAVVCFQYVMAVDAFIYPETATLLYNIYAYVAFALNLAMLASLGHGGRNAIGDNSFNIIRSRWLRNLRGFSTHQRRNCKR